jgi:hypothetical protein
VAGLKKAGVLRHGDARHRSWTYPDVELNHPPQDEHGRVAVAVLDAVDLQIPKNGAERGEEAQHKDEDEADLLADVDLELEQHGDRDDGDHDVGDDGHDGIRRE